MAAVHILIFGGMAGFKIVPFIATHVKMKFFFMELCKTFFSQSELANLHEDNRYQIITTDIKLYRFKKKSLNHLHLLFISQSQVFLKESFSKNTGYQHFLLLLYV